MDAGAPRGSLFNDFGCRLGSAWHQFLNNYGKRRKTSGYYDLWYLARLYTEIIDFGGSFGSPWCSKWELKLIEGCQNRDRCAIQGSPNLPLWCWMLHVGHLGSCWNARGHDFPWFPRFGIHFVDVFGLCFGTFGVQTRCNFDKGQGRACSNFNVFPSADTVMLTYV